MSDFLLSHGVHALLFSIGLALFAAFVQAKLNQPRLAHLLWLLVLAKLLIPVTVSIPGVELPSWAGGAQRSESPIGEPFIGVEGIAGRVDAELIPTLSEFDTLSGSAQSVWVSALLWLWLCGSLVVLFASLVRVARFDLALRRVARPAPAWVESMAEQLAQRFKMRKLPRIQVAHAQVPPLLWWLGGRPRLVLPATLCQEGKAEELRWSMAHELGHLRRGDHVVRWLEWLAVVGFWWNPLAWWARRNLRIQEEICCDQLVLATLQDNPKSYANSLLNVVEFLSSPGLRPPALASGMNSGEALEQRLNMILKNTQLMATPRWMRVVSLAAVVAILPVGFSEAQQPDDPARGQVQTSGQEPEVKLTEKQYARIAERLWGMVAEGEITSEDAERRLARLRGQVESERGKKEEREQARKSKNREVYERMERELKALVEAGRISEADAESRLEEFRRSLENHERQQEGRGVSVEEYKRVATQIEALVAAGRLSRTDADERLLELRRRIQDPKSKEHRAKQIDADYEDAAQAIQKLVEAGRLSPEQARQKLEELRRQRAKQEQSGPGTREEHVRLSREKYYAEISEQLQQMVEAGKITPEQAKQHLDKVREQMAQSEAAEARAAALSREAEAIMKATRDGKLSEEEAAKRMEEMRRNALENLEAARREAREQGREPFTARITIEEYRRLEAQVDALLQAGRITEADAKARKAEARKLVRDQ